MEHLAFCQQIGYPGEAIACIKRSPITEDEYVSLRALFKRDTQRFIDTVLAAPDYRQRFLYLYTRLGSEAVDDHLSRGISEKICLDTFGDQLLWYRNCVRDYGEPGLAEYDWLWLPIKGLLYRLGRLQFNVATLEKQIETDNITLPEGSTVLSTHIPQDEPLMLGDVIDSFRQAKSFFRGINQVFVCHSWLLFPGLSEVLSDSSRIMQFQRLFHIYETDLFDRQAEERIFIQVQDDPSLYQENTSLQRNAKTYLMRGGKLGVSAGYFILKE